MCSFQVAFLDEGMYITPLWILNRFVDVFFSLDIILTFNRAYQESIDNGGHWAQQKDCQYWPLGEEKPSEG